MFSLKEFLRRESFYLQRFLFVFIIILLDFNMMNLKQMEHITYINLHINMC